MRSALSVMNLMHEDSKDEKKIKRRVVEQGCMKESNIAVIGYPKGEKI